MVIFKITSNRPKVTKKNPISYAWQFLFGLVFLLFANVLKAQNDSLRYELYQLGFPFNEGIYGSFEEFKNNKPTILERFEKRGSNLWAWEDSSKSMIVVDPEKIWGYSQAGNVYVSFEDAFWRIINVGQLSQFTAIMIKTFQSVDAFGFPVENQTKSISQLFLDMNDGSIYELTKKNLSHYLEAEPQLENRIKKIKRVKGKDLVLILKAYNQLHPLYFPVYE